MNKSKLKRAWYWFRIIAVFYIMIGIVLYFIQDKLIFHPKKLPADYQFSFSTPFQQVDLKINEQKNLSIVQFKTTGTSRKGIVLYFHGNRQNINRYATHAGDFTRNGFEVWMIDYPGFGKSTGKRTEKILYDDALMFYRMAISQVAADSIIIYGKSLGTGIAAFLASKRDCRKLILETPYYSMDALAKHYFFMYPVMPMTKYTLPTFEHLEFIKAPVSIFHGTRDKVIPYKQAKRLVSAKPGIELITIDKGGHNNLARFPLFQEKLDSLLSN